MNDKNHSQGAPWCSWLQTHGAWVRVWQKKKKYFTFEKVLTCPAVAYNTVDQDLRQKMPKV